MKTIRTIRGKWAVLSPCFPWPVSTEYKKYSTLINFLYDDTITSPTKLLTKNIKINNYNKVIYILIHIFLGLTVLSVLSKFPLII